MAAPHIMIVTGEASGDLHGAHLIRALNAVLTQRFVAWEARICGRKA